MSNLEIFQKFNAGQLAPVVAHVAPPSIDFSTPMLDLSFSRSPVARYMILVFVGSIAKSEQPIIVRKSVFVVQEVPPLMDFHNPPSGAPTYMMFELFGSKRTKFTLP
ncbi:MAG: hypothetical protein ABI623_08540, partial [bacterium]